MGVRAKKAYLSEVLFEGVFSVANASEPRPKDEEEEEEEDWTELRPELECLWAAAASVAEEEVILGRAYLLPPSRFESRDFFFFLSPLLFQTGAPPASLWNGWW